MALHQVRSRNSQKRVAAKGFGHMVSDQLLNKIVHYIVRFGID